MLSSLSLPNNAHSSFARHYFFFFTCLAGKRGIYVSTRIIFIVSYVAFLCHILYTRSWHTVPASFFYSPENVEFRSVCIP